MAFLIVQVPEEGILAHLDPVVFERLQSLPSFHFVEMFAKPGKMLKRTIDCYTFGGVVRLIHESEEQLEADYASLREIEQNLFVVEH